jgi:ferrous iron transport protein B
MSVNNRISYQGSVEYSIEIALGRIENLLKQSYKISKRAVGLLLLEDDEEIKDIVLKREPEAIPELERIVEEAKSHSSCPIEYEIALQQKDEVSRILDRVVRFKEEKIGLGERLSRMTMNPATGIPLLFLILYWGLYKFVGDFGAGTVVDFIEGNVFEEHINPFLVQIFTGVIPWKPVQDLIVGEYGVLTLGFRYAVALILPIVTFFFLVFSIMEDSGYLPRLAMLIDRTFKKIGLNGRAVIPMVLGFGCATMATMVTRTLQTKRERVISTILLALAVPCSAQLGVILALLEGKPAAMLIWAGVVALVFLFIGFLTARLMPGERPSFYMEVPPLRLPKLSNVLTKTYVRVKWYFKEIMPLFILASVFIWFGQITRLFDVIVNVLEKPVEMIGLPVEAATVFLFGFFRRDYGAAGLYDISKQGALNDVQLVVACIALTLFLPCIAQFLMNVKERGWKTGLGISAVVLTISFSAAFTVNYILTSLGVLS